MKKEQQHPHSQEEETPHSVCLVLKEFIINIPN